MDKRKKTIHKQLEKTGKNNRLQQHNTNPKTRPPKTNHGTPHRKSDQQLPQQKQGGNNKMVKEQPKQTDKKPETIVKTPESATKQDLVDLIKQIDARFTQNEQAINMLAEALTQKSKTQVTASDPISSLLANIKPDQITKLIEGFLADEPETPVDDEWTKRAKQAYAERIDRVAKLDDLRLESATVDLDLKKMRKNWFDKYMKKSIEEGREIEGFF